MNSMLNNSSIVFRNITIVIIGELRKISSALSNAFALHFNRIEFKYNHSNWILNYYPMKFIISLNEITNFRCVKSIILSLNYNYRIRHHIWENSTNEMATKF